MGAIGVSPGDEVILPPYTMSATAVAPLFYGGIPVFVDIEEDTFCLDPHKVRAAISPRTRAILAVNLFGHPAALASLRALADDFHLYLVEDNAQAPLASEHDRYAGTIGDIGVFSLNYHKHIHTGEGGVCVTDDSELGRRLQMIRNHAENAVEALEVEDISNLIGFNFRLTEMSAAVGTAQLKNIDAHVSGRQQLAEAMTGALGGMDGLIAPHVRPDCRHVYYVWAVRVLPDVLGVSRYWWSRALEAEGFPHGVGYVKPLYTLPVFQRKRAIGRYGFPFNLGNPRYESGLCPVAERMYAEELLVFEPCRYATNSELIAGLTQALHKVYENRKLLRDHAWSEARKAG
jgi:dTDP-4-amino-4,6-dideoxygalactose transaminase